MKKKFCLMIMLILAVVGVKAAGIPTIPPQCAPNHFHFSGDTLLLNVGPPHTRVFVFNNISNQMIWLNHAPKEPGASAGWGSQIAANHWSAILLQSNQQNVVWTCSKSQGNNTIPLSCETVLKICSFDSAKKPEEGNFWIIENELSEAVVHYAIRDY
ncbi:MAG: hypothetical protein WBE18_04380 [Gammaproteobacteria bacterium]